MSDKPRCCASVWKKGHNSWTGRHVQCTRPGTVARDGKLYCKQHDPEAVKERSAKWDAKYEAERKADEEKSRRRSAEASACSSLPTAALEAGVVGMLVKACERFVFKCENGMAKSKESYGQMKEALALLKEEKP
jgi:hypothetical protein